VPPKSPLVQPKRGNGSNLTSREQLRTAALLNTSVRKPPAQPSPVSAIEKKLQDEIAKRCPNIQISVTGKAIAAMLLEPCHGGELLELGLFMRQTDLYLRKISGRGCPYLSSPQVRVFFDRVGRSKLERFDLRDCATDARALQGTNQTAVEFPDLVDVIVVPDKGELPDPFGSVRLPKVATLNIARNTFLRDGVFKLFFSNMQTLVSLETTGARLTLSDLTCAVSGNPNLEYLGFGTPQWFNSREVESFRQALHDAVNLKTVRIWGRLVQDDVVLDALVRSPADVLYICQPQVGYHARQVLHENFTTVREENFRGRSRLVCKRRSALTEDGFHYTGHF
jgi:hypothetical protein